MKKAIILSLVAIFVSFASVTAQTAKATVPAKAKTETKACCKSATADKAACTKDAKTCTKKAEGKACCKEVAKAAPAKK